MASVESVAAQSASRPGGSLGDDSEEPEEVEASVEAELGCSDIDPSKLLLKLEWGMPL